MASLVLAYAAVTTGGHLLILRSDVRLVSRRSCNKIFVAVYSVRLVLLRSYNKILLLSIVCALIVRSNSPTWVLTGSLEREQHPCSHGLVAFDIESGAL